LRAALQPIEVDLLVSFLSESLINEKLKGPSVDWMSPEDGSAATRSICAAPRAVGCSGAACPAQCSNCIAGSKLAKNRNADRMVIAALKFKSAINACHQTA
jgi:hypothetical protein